MIKTLLIFILVGYICCQNVNLLYNKFNSERGLYCVDPVNTPDSTLVANALAAANNRCNGFAPSGTNWATYGYGTTGSINSAFWTTMESNSMNSYTTSKSNWNCNADSSSSSNAWYRLSLKSTQTWGCAYSTNSTCKMMSGSSSYNAAYLVCYFGSGPSIPVVPTTRCSQPQTCSESPTTTPAPSTPAPSSTAPTATPTSTPVDPSVWLSNLNSVRTYVCGDLEWDSALANDAQIWSNKQAQNSCTMKNSVSGSADRPSSQGENLWKFKFSNTYPAATIVAAGIESWNKGEQGWNCANNTCSISSSNPLTFTLTTIPVTMTITSCGTYTQNIWKATTKVGCAYSTCPSPNQNSYIGTCRFSSPGNIYGQHPLGDSSFCNSTCNRSPSSRLIRDSSIVSISSADISPTKTSPSSPSSLNGIQIAIFVMAITVVVLLVVVLVLAISSHYNKNQEENYGDI